MATTTTTTFTMLKLVIILSVTIFFLTLTSCSAQPTDSDIADGEDWLVDIKTLSGPAARFQPKRIRKGARCFPDASKNICNGVSVNKGTGILYCCKNHCRNVLRDRNHCGTCGIKCGFGNLCCNKTCTSVAYNANHCGKCDVKCATGVSCAYGSCGYA